LKDESESPYFVNPNSLTTSEDMIELLETIIYNIDAQIESAREAIDKVRSDLHQTREIARVAGMMLKRLKSTTTTEVIQ
jgi:hypothetical protein